MTKKKTLADYTEVKKDVVKDRPEDFLVVTTTRSARRVTRPGAAEMPTITFRLSRDRWLKLKELALHENTTIQTLAETAFEAEFKKRGLPW